MRTYVKLLLMRVCLADKANGRMKRALCVVRELHVYVVCHCDSLKPIGIIVIERWYISDCY